jgi:type 1 glutamine amidotransferase
VEVDAMFVKRLATVLGAWTMLAAVACAEPALKALIVDGQNNHAWKDTTPVLKQELIETGLFQVDVATAPAKGGDMSRFKPDFAAYNVIVMNYNGEPWSPETQAALVKYVSGGGGLVIYHAADNSFPAWKEYNEMIGVGGWGGRNEKSGPYVRWRDGGVVLDTTPGPGGSHGPQHPFQLVIRDGQHPITKGLPEKFMHTADELYNRLRGPAKNLTVLATALSPKEMRGTGENEPMLMTIQYGKGRVFHTTLGHAVKQCKDVAFIVTFLRGTEWAATGKVTQKVPADFPGADTPTVRP